MLQTAAELIERRTAGPAQEIRLAAPELVRALEPGQAVLVRAGWGLEPYLRRTFYPIAIDAETWTLRVPPGGDWGHAWLRAAPVGTQIDCLGPVGAGYRLPAGVRNLLCVGEGDATWTLLPAVAQADALGLAITLAMEDRTTRDLIPAQRLPANVEYRTFGTRGTEGIKGTEGTGGARRLLVDLAELLPWADVVFAAGSLAFYGRLAEAVKAARFGLSRGFGQALYPATFLCGVGACQACVADVAGGRRRVCQRGPVLDLADVAG
ncbi:MAG: hypothetical protein NT169_23535 [Chloroflexi bacterium]|nr:hypothetical protein [Chloroflexota bacterium]